MLCTIRVTAQYRENYGTQSEPQWKMKGGVEFIIPEVNDDVILYARTGEVDNSIQQLLSTKSNAMCSYELITWELIFSEPEELSTDSFMEYLMN